MNPLQPHTTTNCPQRSMAWITTYKEDNSNEDDENTLVISATQEMIHLLSEDPTNRPITTIWKRIKSDQLYQIVSTLKTCRTLCICSHQGDQEGQEVLICTDITDLNHMYTTKNNRLQQQNISIIRLNMYGTIEAAFQSQEMMSSSLAVGQPMMRYIHEQDVKEFCAGLNEASKYTTMANFSIRMVHKEQEEWWSEFTVMMVEGGKILCLIKPSINSSTSDTPIVQQPQHCLDKVLRETVTQMQRKFWYAIENGMTLIARSIATSLLLVVQTIWQVCYEDKSASTWTGLFATSSEYMLRKMVKCTKERPEIDQLAKAISWMGISSQSNSRSFIDNTLDQTTEWLISHYVSHSTGNSTSGNEYDIVV